MHHLRSLGIARRWASWPRKARVDASSPHTVRVQNTRPVDHQPPAEEARGAANLTGARHDVDDESTTKGARWRTELIGNRVTETKAMPGG